MAVSVEDPRQRLYSMDDTVKGAVCRSKCLKTGICWVLKESNASGRHGYVNR